MTRPMAERSRAAALTPASALDGPLTLNQLGAIHGRWRALGLAGTGHRAARLALTATLAGAGPIGSTRDLTMGEAGRVIRSLDVLVSRVP